MVIIRKYALLLPAQLAKMELGSYGIESTILDEGVGANAPHFAVFSGIRLAIADQDEHEADTILVAMKERNAT
ncbi:MAG: hypothetical protein QNL01_14665 [Akkermansiaceae bacterium]|tara:strand:+ start:5272 stop:5490 length:219 start_codon:yes stop_codon:yes gene_type:complete